ncbi:MAG: hypothetical protein FD131_3507 [Rhodocyclaceae bacterium]|nr:MAG: hypothetical protein FD131_3507 [Rhodocyclaceae bacterium]
MSGSPVSNSIQLTTWAKLTFSLVRQLSKAMARTSQPSMAPTKRGRDQRPIKASTGNTGQA